VEGSRLVSLQQNVATMFYVVGVVGGFELSESLCICVMMLMPSMLSFSVARLWGL
jgi:hypothetical protein